MLFACTEAARATLDRLHDACREQHERLGDGSVDTFRPSGTARGKRFWFVVDDVQHKDGRLTGLVLEPIPNSRIFGSIDHRPVGAFAILADGTLVGGHPWMRRALGAR